ncbi:ferredoxin reductase [Micromonospora sediminimaris]|uniref:Oxidoreductase n=1 Tax=Micromonospora sediminimaris TaxID=547162 RepID=A0A9W5XHR2_9ACTN|nr:ferredoxin reductase [Micromonospora sediminimaris]GIJ31386.1 oxidoreductase [Micromonospora sediminimaris]SFC42419.1 Ferredoxin-NADP reductase [Micromonospora sediminimaris]
MSWRAARLVAHRTETPTARTLVLEVPGWPAHLPGQHVDIRLTAPDGYQAARSYSLAAPADGDRIEVSVQRVSDGEVSPFLVDAYREGDPVEVRGPIGGWFVWRPQQTEPVLLVAGGSGVVPLMAMIRGRRAAGSRAPFRLIYSVRTPEDAFYTDELRRRVRDDAGLDVAYVYTRQAPEGWRGEPHRLGLADVNTHGWPPELEPLVYVCGPTAFVETVSDLLVGLGHPARRVRTERFGPTG